MKIVVDIPDEVYDRLKTLNSHGIATGATMYIQNGTPLNEVLDKIRAEIDNRKSTVDKAISEDELKIEGLKEAYTDCLEIINKHIDGEKSCIDCKFWLLDKDDENRRCRYCVDMDEWISVKEQERK